MSVKIALAGNPNSGKTTLFNALTGSNQFVGNWPGVTVEKKEGKLKGHKDVIIIDLPGIYSLSPYTLEEVSNEIKQMEEAFDDDTESIITNERYVYISLVWEQLLRYFLSSYCCISCSDHIRREDKMATFCVSLLLVCVIALVIKSMIRDKKNGKSLQCGCDCSKCGGHCH